ERLLGIDIGWITEISRGRRRRHRMTAVECPGVIARIFLIRKFGAAALPFQSHSVFGHVVYIGPHERAATAEHKDRTVAPRSIKARMSTAGRHDGLTPVIDCGE